LSLALRMPAPRRRPLSLRAARGMRGAAWAALRVAAVAALDDGLARTPPMGWRSWNHFGPWVNQWIMEGIMDGMASRKRQVDGVPTSLCDLGFCDVGLDDAWQACGWGFEGYHYHDARGRPIVNRWTFPNMEEITAKAHGLNLTAGWYGNNCICKEDKNATRSMYEQDVRYLTDVFEFDGVKLDNCGTQLDLDLWSSLINATGRKVVIENCHWGETVPTADWCPWHFFRTCGDVRPSYGSVVGNLQTTVRWAQQNLSRPGCWSYPDMLEVGVVGLSITESRSHFGAWCIVSSPLTLSYDVNDDAVSDAVWPFVSNREAIAVNQAWAGHSGSPFKESDARVRLADFTHLLNGVVTVHGDGTVASWQYFQKPLGGGRVAVFMMNHGPTAQTLSLAPADVPGLACRDCHVRDVWSRRDLPRLTQYHHFAADVASHDSVFLVLSPSSTDQYV